MTIDSFSPNNSSLTWQPEENRQASGETGSARRLVILTSVFPSPWLPTKGTFNFEMARSVAQRHDVQVINPISWVDELQQGRSTAWRLENGRSEIRDGFRVSYPRYYYPPKVLRLRYDHFLDWSLPHWLERDLQEFRPEAFLGYWTHPDGTVAVRRARRQKARAWVMVGGSDVLLLSNEPRRGARIRETLDSADGVFVLSHDLRRRLLDWGLSAERVKVFRRGIDRQRFSLESPDESRRKLGISLSTPILVWVGRMVPVKGLELLLAATKQLVGRGVDFQLFLVGDGPLRASIEQMAASNGLERYVRFAGAVPHQDLPDWYRAANWTVLSSHSEGIPNVLLESHACGTPFIATDVGGVSEIVKAGVDRLVPPGETAALADHLEMALTRSTTGVEVRRQLADSIPSLEEAADFLMESMLEN